MKKKYFKCSTISNLGDQTCWNGWVAHEDACYRLYGDQKTWAEALSFCQAKRSSLATLNSEDKTYFAFLQVIKPARLKSNVWIGLSRDLEGKFHWPDSSLMEYSNWSPGNPDSDQRTKKNCTAMNVYSGLWEDEEFDYTHSFLCGRGENNTNLVMTETTMPSFHCKRKQGSRSNLLTIKHRRFIFKRNCVLRR